MVGYSFIVIVCTALSVFALTSAHREAPVIKIDLDLAPRERWTKACQTHSTLFSYLPQLAENYIIPKPLVPLVNIFMREFEHFLPSYIVEEIKGMADATKIDIGTFVFFNILYDIAAFDRSFMEKENRFRGCTSILAEDVNGTVWHARNLDYGIDGLQKILRNMTIEVDFYKNGKILYSVSTYAGLTGVFTAQKHGQFSLSLDERDEGSIFDNFEIMAKGNFTFTSVLAREVIENAGTFDEAIRILSDAVTPAPSYFIVGGIEPGQGAVVTRDRRGACDLWKLASNNTWFVVETNYDHWEPTPASDPRRSVAIKAMETLGRKNLGSEGLFHVLSIVPVLNDFTTYTTMMSASQPDVYATYIR